MNFKYWFFAEVKYKNPVSFHGEPVESDEDVEKISYKKWREKGYTPAQLLRLNRAVANDEFDFYDPTAPHQEVWDFYNDPYWLIVKKLVYEAIPNEDERAEFFKTMQSDPIGNMGFKLLFKPNVKLQEVKELIKDLLKLKVIKSIGGAAKYPDNPPTEITS